MAKEKHTKSRGRSGCSKGEHTLSVLGSVGSDQPFSGTPFYREELTPSASGVEASEEGLAAYPDLLVRSQSWSIESRPARGLSYEQFKEEMRQMMQESIEGVVDKRLQKTEDLISAQLQLTEGQILSAIKHSPFAFMNLFSRIGLAVFGLFFALYVVSEIYLVHPYFSLFGIFSCAAYLAMSKIGQMRHNKRHAPNES